MSRKQDYWKFLHLHPIQPANPEAAPTCLAVRLSPKRMYRLHQAHAEHSEWRGLLPTRVTTHRLKDDFMVFVADPRAELYAGLDAEALIERALASVFVQRVEGCKCVVSIDRKDGLWQLHVEERSGVVAASTLWIHPNELYRTRGTLDKP